MARTKVFRPLTVLVALVSLFAMLIGSVGAQSSWAPRQLNASLKGSGATFPAPLYATWISVYKTVASGVAITYTPVGSGQGQKDFIAYLTDFGGTDSVVNAKTIETQAPDALHVPTVMGAVVPTYNVPGITTLRFSAETLAGIYLGAIKSWDDKRIVADNPGVKLPALAITSVHRSDSSGTTSIWTDYLSKISTEWKSKVGSGNSVKWPVGVGAPGNAGVASTVKNTKGSIGYVELVFALANKLPVPQVKNASGNYITPTLESTTAAADGITLPESLAVSITNSPNKNAYPIAAFTYILVRQSTYGDKNKAEALADFIYWGLTEGTGGALRLGYAPLPANVRIKSIGQLQKITVNGEKVFDGPAQ
jgi:phosphate transport system substrate-binding protein